MRRRTIISQNMRVSDGVYILHTNKRLYTAQQWNTDWNDHAVGVAVVEGDVSFVIAPNMLEHKNGCASQEIIPIVYNDDRSEILLPFNYFYNTESEAMSAESCGRWKSEVIADFIEKHYNEADYSRWPPEHYSAYACRSYIFKNGKTGYLPSLKELWIMVSHQASVEKCLSLIGGDKFRDGTWPNQGYSSCILCESEYTDSISCWCVTQSWADSDWKCSQAANNTDISYIRPFCELF